MSAQRPSSQQKKTAISIIQDPIQPKRATPAESPREPLPFKRPTLADLRCAAPDPPQEPARAAFCRPTLEDMKDVQVPFTLDQKIDPQYKPYTVEDYRDLQQMQDLGDRGGLGPSLDEEWERKQQMRARLMQFGQKAKEENKAVIPKRGRPRPEVKKGPSKRDKMREYAGKIPKPKAPPKEKERIAGEKPKATAAAVAAKYDLEAELHRHDHFVARVEDLRLLVAEYLD
jgi:hypothetical protein